MLDLVEKLIIIINGNDLIAIFLFLSIENGIIVILIMKIILELYSLHRNSEYDILYIVSLC